MADMAKEIVKANGFSDGKYVKILHFLKCWVD